MKKIFSSRIALLWSKKTLLILVLLTTVQPVGEALRTLFEKEGLTREQALELFGRVSGVLYTFISPTNNETL